MCELCEEAETRGDFLCTTGCQNCGVSICYDIEVGDDIQRRACVTSSGDLYCDLCAARYDVEEEEDAEHDAFDDLLAEDWWKDK